MRWWPSGDREAAIQTRRREDHFEARSLADMAPAVLIGMRLVHPPVGRDRWRRHRTGPSSLSEDRLADLAVRPCSVS
jgi:hypothetical protein